MFLKFEDLTVRTWFENEDAWNYKDISCVRVERHDIKHLAYKKVIAADASRGIGEQRPHRPY